MATYDSKYVSGARLKSIVHDLVASFNPVAFTGDYNDLSNKPFVPTIETMSVAEGDTIVSNVLNTRIVSFVANDEDA